MSEILGVLFAILVGTLVIPKFGQFQKASNDASTATITAQQQKQLVTAATAYMQQNATVIQATATATTPVVVTVPMLQAPAVNLLPASFSALNPYGQTWQVEVLQPSAGNLQALAMSIGGATVPDMQAGKIAAIVGAAGGLIPQNDSGIYAGGAANAYGAASGWTISTANYQSVSGGHPAALITFQNGQLNSNYLYRNAVPGQPQLNTMNTPLVMGSVQTAGAACTTTGAIAQDGSGVVLSCQGGTWKLSGDGKCVSTTADLNNLQTDGRCYNGVALPNSPAGGEWVFVEVFRHFNAGVYYVAQRVTGMTGAAVGGVWQRNQQSGTQAGGWSTWVQQADALVQINHANGENSGMISIKGSDGTAMYMETLPGGTLRFVNSPFSAQIASIDQGGNIAGASITVPAGNNLRVGGSAYYGDGSNSAIRQNDSLYIQHYDGSPAPIANVAGINQNNGDHNISGGSVQTFRSGYWGLLMRDAGGDNAQPQNTNGSGYVNDMYFRSIGKWASQLGGYTNFFNVIGADVSNLQTSIAYCPAGSRMISGGYQLIAYNSTNGLNSPDVNLPNPGANGWQIAAAAGNNVFRSYALCAS